MLSIIGIVVIIVATIQVYKTANSTGRNAVLWAILTLCVGFGIQWVIPLLVGIVLGLIWVASGTDPTELQSKITGPALIIGIGCLVASFVALWIIMKTVSRVPEQPVVTRPPPPPNFS